MSKDRIARCIECNSVDFVNRETLCEFCEPTSELLYSTGMLVAAGAPVNENEPEAA